MEMTEVASLDTKFEDLLRKDPESEFGFQAFVLNLPLKNWHCRLHSMVG